MGSRKPDDNKGKGKAPASSTPPPILESNDILQNDMDMTSGQNFTGDILHYSTIAGTSPAYGSGLSTFMPHSSSYPPRGIGLQIAATTSTQPVITNQTRILFAASLAAKYYGLWGATHQTGPSHGGSVGNIRPGAAADNILGQGLHTALPQASNILGRRTHESSPLPSPTPSSPSSHESTTLALQDSSQPGVLQPSGQICMLCDKDIMITPDSPVSALPCGHVFHDECLKNIIPKDQANNPLCIVCLTREP